MTHSVKDGLLLLPDCCGDVGGISGRTRALGAALFFYNDNAGENAVFRLGSLSRLSLGDEGGNEDAATTHVQLTRLFEDTCDAFRLGILRDMRLRLAIPLEDEVAATALPIPPIQLRTFKPLIFSPEGR